MALAPGGGAMKVRTRLIPLLGGLVFAGAILPAPALSGGGNPQASPRQRKTKEMVESFAFRPSSPLLAGQWAPLDVDNAVPAVAPDAPCPLDDALHGVSQRVVELVTNLQQFTAKESLEHRELDPDGTARAARTRRYSYMVAISETRPGRLSVEEYRNGVAAFDDFPARVATMGLPALALIFHPALIEDFQLSCEGLGDWRGQPAWQVYFRQRADRPSRIRSYRVRGITYPVNLKGRAWIAVESFQVVSLETDLMDKIREIPLEREHITIEYRPVQFKKRGVELWLPQSAELFFHYRGHRMYRRHAFSDFELFSVDVRQQIEDPKVSDP